MSTATSCGVPAVSEPAAGVASAPMGRSPAEEDAGEAAARFFVGPVVAGAVPTCACQSTSPSTAHAAIPLANQNPALRLPGAVLIVDTAAAGRVSSARPVPRTDSSSVGPEEIDPGLGTGLAATGKDAVS